jgi:(p)ppGpp synthase/HD superfamily hydrolase
MQRDYRLKEACELAARAHAGQFLPGSDTPYIAHPMAVGIMLTEAGATSDAVIAGILHNAVEAGQLSLVEIEKLFGPLVLSLVKACSEVDKSSSWGRVLLRVRVLKSGVRILIVMVWAIREDCLIR